MRGPAGTGADLAAAGSAAAGAVGAAAAGFWSRKPATSAFVRRPSRPVAATLAGSILFSSTSRRALGLSLAVVPEAGALAAAGAALAGAFAAATGAAALADAAGAAPALIT